MESRVAVLHKKQVESLLASLKQAGVFSEEDYDRCNSKSTRVEKCKALLEILENKDGGIRALHAALDALPPHGPNQREEPSQEEGTVNLLIANNEENHQKIVAEKDEKITKLQTENAKLKKELNEKTKELNTLRKEEDLTDGKKQAKEESMHSPDFVKKEIHTMTYKEKAERGRIDGNPETIEGLVKKNVDLEREVTSLKESIANKEQAMGVVNKLEELYPYIKDVLDCPVYHIRQSAASDSPTVPMYCLPMKFDDRHVNHRFCHISQIGGSLINASVDDEKTHGYRKYQGTTGTIPIILPLSTSTVIPPPLHYWESHTVVELTGRLISFYPLLEMGVCEEGWVDKMSWIHKQPRSWSIRVGVCRTHRWGICAQVWGRQQQQGLCFTHAMSNTPQKTSTLCYGIVVDVARGKVAFLDLSKERVMHTFSVTFKETLYPVFGMEPWLESCYVNMELMSGDSNMTDNKKRLIEKALRL